MAKALKDNGLQEIGAFKRRVRRQRAFGKIGQEDHDELIRLVELIEKRVVEMNEEGVDDPWQ
jgi:hypothetical protein